MHQLHTDHTDLLALIQRHYRERVDAHKAEKTLTLQSLAVLRRVCGGDKDEAQACLARIEKGEAPPMGAGAVLFMVASREAMRGARKEPEKVLRKLARQLPIWPWVAELNGLGDLSVAQIIAELGDPLAYSNPAKVWKRMGLAVIEGSDGTSGRQRRVKGDEALLHGYCAERRSIMWVVGDCIIKKQNAYRELYLARKEIEALKVPDGTKALWHNRAKRYMEKRLLRDMWREWRRAVLGEMPQD